MQEQYSNNRHFFVKCDIIATLCTGSALQTGANRFAELGVGSGTGRDFLLWDAVEINRECRPVAWDNPTVKGMPKSEGDIGKPSVNSQSGFERDR